MPWLPDDDLYGIWWVARSQPEEAWPASVVERLAAALIEERGGNTSDVEAVMSVHSDTPVPDARPMIDAPRHEVKSLLLEGIAPEFDPEDVEEEVLGGALGDP